MIKKIIFISFVLLTLIFIIYFSISANKANSVHKDYSIRSEIAKELVFVEQYKQLIVAHFNKYKKFPKSNSDLEGNISIKKQNISISKNGALIVNFTNSVKLKEVSIIWEPVVNDKEEIIWNCTGLNLESKLLPSSCNN